MRTVNVFFDLEDQSHKPDVQGSNAEGNIHNILSILDRFKAKATFCTCGILVETYPSLIKRIHEEGHEIASHGYMHENFFQLSQGELDDVLSRTERAINRTVGENPIGIRCPWLMSNRQIYDVIEKRGYKWVSNKYRRFPEMDKRPDRGPGTSNKTSITVRGMRKKREMKRELGAYPKVPYPINSMFEIPMLSSMDGDLLFYLSPRQKSPEAWLDYAFESLVSQFDRSTSYFNLNFHPWVIASANRISLLERILEYISGKDAYFAPAKDFIATIATMQE